MTDDDCVKLIRAASAPLEPIATDVLPELPELDDVRAVLFDVYGTLLVSGSGDVGAADPTLRGQAVIESLAAVGLDYRGDGDEGAAELRRQIEASHDELRASGIEYPEVQIDKVWAAACGAFHSCGRLPKPPADLDYRQLAVEFEVRTNPIWPMPGARECLETLGRRGAILGIISNAQFFTPLALEATLNRRPEQLGFDAALQYYSYEHGQAKPGVWLYQQAADALRSRSVAPSQTLYVGNDMRNDVWPAAEVGFRTALFAGDGRSLRMRREDPQASRRRGPDAVAAALDQIPGLVGSTIAG